MAARSRAPPGHTLSQNPGFPSIRDPPPYGRSILGQPHPAIIEGDRSPRFSRGPVQLNPSAGIPQDRLPPPGMLQDRLRPPGMLQDRLPPPGMLQDRLPPPGMLQDRLPPPGMLQDRLLPAGMHPDRLAAQHSEIQALLVDNHGLAATHVALKQELELAQHEIRRLTSVLGSSRAETDPQLRDGFEKVSRMESDLRAFEAMKVELVQVRSEIQQLTLVRQDLTGQVQAMSQDLDRAGADLQKIPTLKAEIDGMRKELQRARAAIEYEEKGYSENYEHGQAMEKNMISMARELEKLQGELANAEKRSRAVAAAANPGARYAGNYGNTETPYGTNLYIAAYGGNPTQSGGAAPQYGNGSAAWGMYDMQQAHGRR